MTILQENHHHIIDCHYCHYHHHHQIFHPYEIGEQYEILKRGNYDEDEEEDFG